MCIFIVFRGVIERAIKHDQAVNCKPDNIFIGVTESIIYVPMICHSISRHFINILVEIKRVETSILKKTIY